MTDLNDRERVERGARAKRAMEEFITPEFGFARQQYLDRIAEVAATELNPALRAEKITVLSYAVRVLQEVEGSVSMVILEGEKARADMIRVEKIEQMTDAQRRLAMIAPL